MKLLKPILIFVLLLPFCGGCGCGFLHAQIQLGIKAGADFIQLPNDREFLDAKYRSGFFVGPTLKAEIPKSFGADLSLLIDHRSAKITSNVFNEEESLSCNTLNIPVNLRFYVVNTSMLDLFVKAGPQFCVYLGDKKFSDIVDDYKREWEDSEISLNIGAGITIIKTLELSANYNIYCGRTSDARWADFYERAKESVKHDMKNQAWQLSAVYYF